VTDAATLGVAAGIALGAWLVVLTLLAVATRAREPDAAPPTMDLGGDEPPGVVNLITRGWQVGMEAVPATLIDLAARKLLALERVGPDRFVVRVPDRQPVGLTPYEKQVDDHVRSLASGGVVHCEALTTGPENESKQWWKRFRTSVSADARGRGLSRPRWARTHLAVLGALAVAPAGLAAGAFAALPSSSSSKSDDGGVLGLIFVAVILWLALMTIPGSLRAERDTPAGLAAASRWLGLRRHLEGDANFAEQPPAAVAIWDRLLSYGAAMGVAPGAVRALAMGADSETEAWTAYGGRWRVVHVSYPWRFPPGWGRSPAGAVAIGFAILVPATLVAYALRDLFDDASLISLAVVAVPVALMAYGLVMVWRGGADIGRRVTREGLVLRRKEIVSSSDSGTHTTAVYLAVYGGQGGEVRALRCTPEVASGVHPGSLVRATISPRLAHVYSLEPLPR
jgi:hypothetical protein